MNVVTAKNLRDMKPLRVANDLIGDPVATAARLEADGYLFFRDVLDKEAVATMRRAFVDVLIHMGVVDSGADQPIWNGADLTDFPVKVEPLHDTRVWERFTAEPAVEAFFAKLLGVSPFWVPIVEYRLTPPQAGLPEDPFFGRHQDGFYNEGISFATCWIPLMEIDGRIGGLALAPGMHKQGYLHDLDSPPQYRIPPEVIPLEAWHRSDYGPGDLVMFNTWIPHSGLPNISDRFRLSMDIRVAPSTGNLPVLGEVRQLGVDSITIHNHDGRDVTLALDEDTYCRWTAGKRLPLKEMLGRLSIGDRVMAAVEGGKAIVLRPPR